jgi:hypothetical protein
MDEHIDYEADTRARRALRAEARSALDDIYERRREVSCAPDPRCFFLFQTFKSSSATSMISACVSDLLIVRKHMYVWHL